MLAAGPKALARRDAALRQFTGFLDAGRAETSVELPGITSLSLAGGINELLYSEILHGAAARLPGRLPDLMFWITLPFLGPEGGSVSAPASRCSKAKTTPVKPLFSVNAGVYLDCGAGNLGIGGIDQGFRWPGLRRPGRKGER